MLNDDRKLEIEPHEAEAVKIIFEMFDNGYGYTAIINRLNELGYVTKRGCIFGKNSLYEILSNPKYAGDFVFNRLSSKDCRGKRNSNLHKSADQMIVVEGGCPQIVSKELYERVQKRKEANRRNAGRYHSKEFYLLTGKLFCGICGKRMIGNVRYSGRNKSRLATYRCQTHRSECRNKEINKDYLDVYIVDLLRQKLFNAKALRKIVNGINKYISRYNDDYDSHYASVKAEYDEIQANLDNITKAVVELRIRAKADNTDEINKFETLPRDSEPFFLLIQRYVKSIVVTGETVTFFITNGESDNVIKKYRHKREKFDCKVKWHRS